MNSIFCADVENLLLYLLPIETLIHYSRTCRRAQRVIVAHPAYLRYKNVPSREREAIVDEAIRDEQRQYLVRDILVRLPSMCQKICMFIAASKCTLSECREVLAIVLDTVRACVVGISPAIGRPLSCHLGGVRRLDFAIWLAVAVHESVVRKVMERAGALSHKVDFEAAALGAASAGHESTLYFFERAECPDTCAGCFGIAVQGGHFAVMQLYYDRYPQWILPSQLLYAMRFYRHDHEWVVDWLFERIADHVDADQYIKDIGLQEVPRYWSHESLPHTNWEHARLFHGLFRRPHSLHTVISRLKLDPASIDAILANMSNDDRAVYLHTIT